MTAPSDPQSIAPQISAARASLVAVMVKGSPVRFTSSRHSPPNSSSLRSSMSIRHSSVTPIRCCQRSKVITNNGDRTPPPPINVSFIN